jgi:hypothetical protein
MRIVWVVLALVLAGCQTEDAGMRAAERVNDSETVAFRI